MASQNSVLEGESVKPAESEPSRDEMRMMITQLSVRGPSHGTLRDSGFTSSPSSLNAHLAAAASTPDAPVASKADQGAAHVSFGADVPAVATKGRASSIVFLPVAAADQTSAVEFLRTLPQSSTPTPASHGMAEEKPEAAAHDPASSSKAGKGAEYVVDEHMLTLVQLQQRYGMDINMEQPAKSKGLSRAEAASRLTTYGRNLLTPPPSTPEWIKFLKQFTNLLMVLLLIASGLGFLAYGLTKDTGDDKSAQNNLILGSALLVIVTLTCSMSYLQERQAGNVIASIQGMMAASTKVVRDGQETSVPADSLVPGDIVHLTIGNRVPADVRIIASNDLKVEMSSLTGESDAVECSAEKRSDMPTEAHNIIFNSSMVMNGDCYGIVYRTGDTSMIGVIARMAGGGRTGMTTMEKEVHRLVVFIALAAVSTSIAFFVIGIVRGWGVIYSFVNAFILVLIANVPEGLPASVTSILTLSAQTLATHNVFIKRTDLIETLGCASVICSDKTGTLTQNKMSVSQMWFNDVVVDALAKVKKVSGPAAKGLPPTMLALLRRPAAAASGTEQQQHLTSVRAQSAASQAKGTGAGKGGFPRSPALVAIPEGTALTPSGADILASMTAASIPAVQDWPKDVPAGAAPAVERDIAAEMTVGRGMRLVDGTMYIHSARALEPTAGPKREALSSVFGASSATSTSTAAKPVSASLSPSLSYAKVEDGAAILQIRGFGLKSAPTDTLATMPDLELPSARSVHPGADELAVESTYGTDGVGGSVGSFGHGSSFGQSSTVGRLNQLTMGSVGMDNIASFQSFRGFTRASWAESNAFTRLMTIAAVCNRAKFAGSEDGETSGADRNASHGDTAAVVGAGSIALTFDGDSAPAVLAASAAAGSPSILAVEHPESNRTYGAGGLPLGPAPEPSSLSMLTLRSIPGSYGSVKSSKGGKASKAYQWVKPNAGTGDGRKVLGDASEAALLRYADSLVPVEEFRAAYPLLFEIPFNSANKWAYAVVPAPEEPGPTRVGDQEHGAWPLGTGKHIALLKGAPERIIDRCTHWLKEGSGGSVSEVPIDADFKAQWGAAYERFGLSGERVLAFAYRTFTPPQGAPECYKANEDSRPMDGLVFAGLISLIDPPKEGVAEAVSICRQASIRVTMVTGDHPLTAEAIARKVGIITMKTAREVAAEEGVPESSIPLDDPRVGAVVLAGYSLPDLTEADWDAVLSKLEVVFARTSPQQKTEIVSHYQRLGHIVAVTGDGTNDAPALKQADMGVAMGSAGASDVAREAADMVLTDDNFASIVVAITMGRTVFDNIRKTIAYTVAHAIPELLPIFVLLLLDIPIMLPGLLVLTIDLLTEQWPAISLAYEPAETAVMQRPPRDMKRDRLVDGRLLRYSYLIIGLSQFFLCVASFFLTTHYFGIPGSFFLYNRNKWSGTSDALVVDGRIVGGEEQLEVWRRGVAAFYLTLILCQAWHVFLTKTRAQSLFKHGIFTNKQSAYGALCAVLLACFFVYVPGVQDLFDTRNPSFVPWIVNLAFPAIFVPFTEYSKWKVRNDPQSWWSKHVAW